MEQKELYDIFAKMQIFENTNKKTIIYAIDKSKVLCCKKGELLFDSKRNAPCLYIILKGSASVFGQSKNKPVILNTLAEGKLFGMASLFGEKCNSTTIVAKEDCSFVLIPQECVEHMLGLDVDFAKNYIRFLSEKIRFLNKKITFFTSENTEKKVAKFILSLPYDTETNCVTLDIKIAKLAQNLDIGRASLYRAFDLLEEKGFLKKENNVIKFTSYDEFKKIYGEQQ